MLELHRYRPAISVLGGLFLVLWALYQLSEWILLPHLGTAQPVTRALQEIAAKCRAAQKESGDSLGLVVGTSSSIDGVMLGSLASKTRLRWMNLSQPCRSVLQLEATLAPLFASGVRPKVLILGVNPMLLAEKPKSSLLECLRQTERTALLLGAVQIQGAGYAAAKTSNPFREVFRTVGPVERSAVMQSLSQFDEDGRKLPDSYRQNNTEARALRRLLKKCQSIADVTIVLKMPESSIVRGVTPAAADEVLDEILEQETRPSNVHDFRALLDDQVFSDGVHQNEIGREELTKQVLKLLDGHGLTR
jgi:hypothetical protein